MPKIVVENANQTFEVPDGKELKELCEQNNIDLPFGCKEGVCGTCIITVQEGADNLTPKTDQEKETLENFMATPEQRLACQCKAKGDVKFKY